MVKRIDWGDRAQKGFLASGIDPADQRGHKNFYIDFLQKAALQEVLDLKGDEVVLDFGCGSGRISYWIAPRVRKVIGLETTQAMVDLAEKHRTADNVEFLIYDGLRFPSLPDAVDLLLSVGVLQHMRERLKTTVSELGRYLRKGGRFCLIEQASDNPNIDRPGLKEYLGVFEELKLECLRYYPIRDGRWWPLYLIRYGVIPKRWVPRLASWELEKKRQRGGMITHYRDYLFFIEKRWPQ